MLQSQLNQVESSCSRPLDRMQPNIDWSPWRSTRRPARASTSRRVKPRLAQVRGGPSSSPRQRLCQAAATRGGGGSRGTRLVSCRLRPRAGQSMRDVSEWAQRRQPVTRCGLLRRWVDGQRPATDRELLLGGDAAAFAVFYDRHAEWALGCLRRRSPDAAAAADLTAEVFTPALGDRRRYRPRERLGRTPGCRDATSKLTGAALRATRAARRTRLGCATSRYRVTTWSDRRLAEATVVVELAPGPARVQRAADRAPASRRSRVRDDRGAAGRHRGRGPLACEPRLAGLRRRWEAAPHDRRSRALVLDRLRAELRACGRSRGPARAARRAGRLQLPRARRWPSSPSPRWSLPW